MKLSKPLSTPSRLLRAAYIEALNGKLGVRLPLVGTKVATLSARTRRQKLSLSLEWKQ